ncbi:DUF2252 family protein [Streptomyces sp. NPDC055955]|uniref:DUF2252 family protein n=1 Tax=Streptomyces sp. NPDC055955 TaxID=3345665 RepID=UPI0035D97D7A
MRLVSDVPTAAGPGRRACMSRSATTAMRASPHIPRTRRASLGRPPPQPGRAGGLGQRLMPATSDIFLGRERANGMDGGQRDFDVRQLRDGKGIAMPETWSPKGRTAVGELSGVTLARAHARSGDRRDRRAVTPSTAPRRRPRSPRPTPTRTSATTKPTGRRGARGPALHGGAADGLTRERRTSDGVAPRRAEEMTTVHGMTGGRRAPEPTAPHPLR